MGYNIFCTGHSHLSDGRLLVTGGHITNGNGLPDASLYNAFNNTWTRLADMNNGRWYPTNVTLANGEALTISGSYGDPAVNNSLPQVWTGSAWRSLTGAVLSLPLYPAMHLAPNGKVFLAGPGQTTRCLDTAGAGAWSTVADRQFGSRSYGSSVLYDNGKVAFIGGGDDNRSAEVYSPPYLFKGARPSISSAPASTGYGQSFFVGTPNGASIEDVTWLRLGSVTHATNMDQRINHLGFWRTTNGLTVTAPSSDRAGRVPER